MLEERRKQLYEVYQIWEKELKDACPQLITKEYSHPYYLHIPDDWFVARHRILIVGEEGFGNKQFDLPIADAQVFNRNYLLAQLTHSADNRSPFWQRIRKIANNPDVSIAWTNLDMIHRSGRKGCALKKRERMALHQTPTAILKEEIRLLEPTVIVYFGWYGISLQAELPDVFRILYPRGLKDYSQWQDDKMKVIELNGIHHIFTYHPGWGQRVKGYEDMVLQTVTKVLKKNTTE